MGLYVYQGFWEDCLVLGGNVVWPNVGNSGNFSIILVKNNANLDTTSGLNVKGITTWGALESQIAIEEMPDQGQGTNYMRFDLNVLARTANWDPNENTGEMELQYNNANYPITWPNLTAGHEIGAYVVVRKVDGASADKVWMADSDATGLPATTNGEDFTITLNAEAFLKGYHPNQN